MLLPLSLPSSFCFSHTDTVVIYQTHALSFCLRTFSTPLRFALNFLFLCCHMADPPHSFQFLAHTSSCIKDHQRTSSTKLFSSSDPGTLSYPLFFPLARFYIYFLRVYFLPQNVNSMEAEELFLLSDSLILDIISS